MVFKRKQQDDDLARLQSEIAALEAQLREQEILHGEDEDYELLSLLEEDAYYKALNSTYSFLQYAWDSFETVEFRHGKHLQAIGEHLDACVAGQIKNLIINIQPRCLPAKTEILLPNNTYKPISELQVGDAVVSSDGTKLINQKVTAVMHTGLRDCVEIKTSNGIKLQASKDHKVFTLAGWKKAEELETKDVLVVPRKFADSHELIPLDDAFLLGLWVAEGFKANRSAYAFANNDDTIINRAKEIAARRGWQYRYDKQFTHRLINAEGLVRGSKVKGKIRLWFEQYFPGNEHPTNCYDVRVPSAIFKASNSVKIEFLNAYIAGDGCVDINGKITSTSASRNLTKDIYRLWRQLGFSPTLKTLKARITTAPQGLANGKVQYSCSVSGTADLLKAKQLFTFYHKQQKLDGLRIKEKNNKRQIPTKLLNPQKFNSRFRYRLTKDRFWNEATIAKASLYPEYTKQWLEREVDYVEVISVTDIGQLDCYDISVENTEAFFAEDILVHNCSKTSIVSKAFPAYLWIKKPKTKIINLSYSFDLSVKDSVGSKTIITSPWYQRGLNSVWKEALGDDYIPWELSRHTNLKYDYETTVGGRRYATSVQGTVYGSGGDFLIVDDPLNPVDANSKITRDKTNEILGQIFSTRLNDRETGCRILIAQRLCEGDSTDYFLEQGGWEHLVLPTEWDETRRYWTSIGWTDWRTKEGELLNPSRFNYAAIAEIKRELGEYGYAAQCQQSPVPLGGGIIKPEWFNTWFIMPNRFDATCMAFDLSMKDGASSDYTALIVMGRQSNRFYVLDLVYGLMDIVKQVEAIAALCAKYPWVRTRLVEQKANGQAVLDLLKRHVTGLVPVNPKAGETKENRIMACVPEINAGNVYLPDVGVMPQIRELIDEAKMFPKGRRDDVLDAYAYAHNYLAVNCIPSYAPLEVITETSETYTSRAQMKQIVENKERGLPSVRLNTQRYIHSLFGE